MTQLLRTLAILTATAFVVGATWLLTPASTGTEGRRRPPREGQAAPGRERDDGGINIFGLGHVLRDTVIVTVVTVVVVSLERVWAKRTGRTLGAE
jgi:hypothetical protein